MDKKEERGLYVGIIFAILLSVFAQVFVTSFFTMIESSRIIFFHNPKNLLIVSAIALAALVHWFFQKTK